MKVCREFVFSIWFACVNQNYDNLEPGIASSPTGTPSVPINGPQTPDWEPKALSCLLSRVLSLLFSLGLIPACHPLNSLSQSTVVKAGKPTKVALKRQNKSSNQTTDIVLICMNRMSTVNNGENVILYQYCELFLTMLISCCSHASLV